MLGFELMPWQEQVIEVGTEYDPETGIPFYREIDLLVPRQSGKTSGVVLVMELDRALFWPRQPQNIAYTAQTGQDARVKLVEDQLPLIERSEIGPTIRKALKGAALTSVKFRTDSRIDVVATSQEAGHGRTYGLAVIDEARADYDNRREGGLVPTMSTIADAQVLVTSTAGTERSTYLRRKVDVGRKLVDAGKRDGIAYFEWSAPDDADPDDVEVWWGCMPALGQTITPAAVEHARLSLSETEFRQAYLNQWVAAHQEYPIPAVPWESVCDPTVQVVQPRAFAVDCPPERDRASIVVAVHDSAEVAAMGEGVGWTVDWLAERAAQWRVPVAVDRNGPAGSLVTALESRNVNVVGYTPADVAKAAGVLHDRVVDGSVAIRQEPVLDQALAGSKRRPVSGAWAFGRRDMSTDISPLVALSIAVYAASQPGGPTLSVISLADL